MPGQAALELVREFVKRKLEPWPAFQAALVTGSVGHAEAREDSDVDMVLVFDPLDARIVPGEFVWTPTDDEFHTIFEASVAGGVQIDAKRLSVDYLEHDEFIPGFQHELAHAVVVFDRSGRVGRILEGRLEYPDERRRALALRHREWAWIHQAKALAKHRDRWISRVGWAGAVDLLLGGLEEVVLSILACNGEFPPYRYRWLLAMEKLEWVPPDFASFRDAVVAPQPADQETTFLQACEAFDRVLAQIDERFRRWARDAGHLWSLSHAELGFAYNMELWKQAHQALLAERNLDDR